MFIYIHTGDEIESPDGDPSEVYRILFDITFFFFVIIILLAIIQGKLTIRPSSLNGLHFWLNIVII